jgi:hypothetical protein
MSEREREQHERERAEHDEREPEEHGGTRDRPADIGKADTPNVAGSDVQQPEIAEGPVPGLEPGEEPAGDPDRYRPPEIDPLGPDLPRSAAGDPDAVREQKERGGP